MKSFKYRKIQTWGFHAWFVQVGWTAILIVSAVMIWWWMWLWEASCIAFRFTRTKLQKVNKSGIHFLLIPAFSGTKTMAGSWRVEAWSGNIHGTPQGHGTPSHHSRGTARLCPTSHSSPFPASPTGMKDQGIWLPSAMLLHLCRCQAVGLAGDAKGHLGEPFGLKRASSDEFTAAFVWGALKATLGFVPAVPA